MAFLFRVSVISAALLVYDVSNRKSFDSLESWLLEMKQEIGKHQTVDNVLFFVCANKVTAKVFVGKTVIIGYMLHIICKTLSY